MKKIFKNIADFFDPKTRATKGLFKEACKENYNLKKIQKYLGKGANPLTEVTYKYKEFSFLTVLRHKSALQEAYGYHKIDLVNLFIEKSQQDELIKTDLLKYDYCKYNSAILPEQRNKYTSLLLEKNIPFNASDLRYLLHFNRFLFTKALEKVSTLTSVPEFKSWDHREFIETAIIDNNQNLTDLLIEKKAQISQENIVKAAKRDSPLFAKLLGHFDPSKAKDLYTEIINNCPNTKIEFIKSLLDKNIPISTFDIITSMDSYGTFIALINKNPIISEIILNTALAHKKAPTLLAKLDEIGYDFHKNAYNNLVQANAKAIKTLLTYKLNVNVRGGNNNTPLIDAVKKNENEKVKALIAAGADETMLDNEGFSALDYARIEAFEKTFEKYHMKNLDDRKALYKDFNMAAKQITEEDKEENATLKVLLDAIKERNDLKAFYAAGMPVNIAKKDLPDKMRFIKPVKKIP